jgi:hypothetical protein
MRMRLVSSPLGRRRGLEQLAHGVRQGGDLFHALGHGIETRPRELEAVDHGGAQPVLDRGGEVTLVGRDDQVALGPTQCRRRAQEHGVLAGGVRVGQRTRGLLGAPRERGDERLDVFCHDSAER